MKSGFLLMVFRPGPGRNIIPVCLILAGMMFIQIRSNPVLLIKYMNGFPVIFVKPGYKCN